MKICPKCGYEDSVIWRQNRWVAGVEYADIDDFINECPHFKDISPGQTVSDNLCYYYRGKRRGGRKFVYRWPRFLGPTYYTKTRHFFEHHVPRVPVAPGQQTLDLETMVKTDLRKFAEKYGTAP